MAKKQTRRSISVSRTTYERLKAYCEASNISMSQLVETRVNDFLGEGVSSPVIIQAPAPVMPRPVAALPQRFGSSINGSVGSPPPVVALPPRPISSMAAPAPGPFAEPPRAPAPTPPAVTPMTSSAARSIVEPPPPIIKPRQVESAPKPAEKRPDQIFTF